MELFLFILFAILTTSTVIIPTVRAKRINTERALITRYRDFKLYSIKKYHPAFREGGPLSELSYEEIRRSYDLDACYNQIG